MTDGIQFAHRPLQQQPASCCSHRPPRRLAACNQGNWKSDQCPGSPLAQAPPQPPPTLSNEPPSTTSTQQTPPPHPPPTHTTTTTTTHHHPTLHPTLHPPPTTQHHPTLQPHHPHSPELHPHFRVALVQRLAGLHEEGHTLPAAVVDEHSDSSKGRGQAALGHGGVV